MSVKKELDIVQAVKIFFEGPKEVRIPHTQHNGTMAGVFDDPAKLIASVLSDAVQGQKRSIYWTLQRLDPSKCTVTNALHPHAIKTAKDQDILEYRWLLIDCDPVKHEDGEISATDAE